MYNYFLKFYNIFSSNKRYNYQTKFLYQQIISQSRKKVLYKKFEIKDTLEGRFDFLLLHYCIILIKIKSLGEENKNISQDLFDYFIKDIENNLREIGVSDIKIGKEVKKISSAIIGRYNVYKSAIDGKSDLNLKKALKKNIYRNFKVDKNKTDHLIRYIRKQTNHLKKKDYNNMFIEDIFI